MESDHPGRHPLASNIEVIGELPPDHEGYDVSDTELIVALSLAESKHFWHLSRNELIARRLRKAGAEPGSTFLELGCGGGVVAAALVAEGYKVTGVDGHLPRVAEAARRAPQARFLVKDLRVGFDGLGSGYDSVGLFDVIEHLDDPRDVLQSAASLLRPGGLLVGTVPALMSLWSEIDVVSGHRLRYDLRGLSDLLSKVVGAETIEVKYFNRILVAPMWVVRRKTTKADTKDTIIRQLTPPRPWVNATALAAFRTEHRSSPLLDAARIPGSSVWFAIRKQVHQGAHPPSGRHAPPPDIEPAFRPTERTAAPTTPDPRASQGHHRPHPQSFHRCGEPYTRAVSIAGGESSDAFNPRVVEANQRVHSQLASQYNESEPHFRPENQAKVRRRLVDLAARTPSTERMLDLGCGTGFMLNLAHDLFTAIDGIDATRAMLDRVDLSPGNITLHQGVVEALPFKPDTFDLATAYSFLDHLADHVPVLHEAHRVLRPGGMLYVDLIPNRSFWNGVYSASASSQGPFDAIVEREINELVNHEQKLQEQFGIDPVDLQYAEPAKSEGRGFDGEQLRAELEAIGFSADIRYEWYLGQAIVMHGDSTSAAEAIDAHLRRLLPVSESLFKYIVLTATKR